MASKPETTFTHSVHKHLPSVKVLHREKMNNPYSSGTADVWYSASKNDLWIEYKFLPRVPQRGIVWLCKPDVKKPDLSRLQQEWLRGRYEEGRNVGVIVGCPSGGVILRDLAWELSMSAKEFVSRIQTRQEIAQWIKQEVLST